MKNSTKALLMCRMVERSARIHDEYSVLWLHVLKQAIVDAFYVPTKSNGYHVREQTSAIKDAQDFLLSGGGYAANTIGIDPDYVSYLFRKLSA